jgi:hypothetical protein
MNRLPKDKLNQLLEELRQTRIAAEAARRTGVQPATARRIARQNQIELISQAEHMQRRVRDPGFRAAQRRGSQKRRLAKEKYDQVLAELRQTHNATETARRTGVAHSTAWRIAKRNDVELAPATEHLDQHRNDPANRAAAAEHRRACWADPAYRQRVGEAIRRGHAERRKLKQQQRCLDDDPTSPAP